MIGDRSSTQKLWVETQCMRQYLRTGGGRFDSFGLRISNALPCPSPSRVLVLCKVSSMAPYFLRNLLPKKERVEHVRPLWEVLAGLTWTQWGLFFSG